MTLALQGAVLARGGRQVLHGLDLAAEAGELLAIIGPNGAGKSSAMALFSGELAPAAGAVTLDARPLARWHPSALARRRAVVTQGARIAFPFRVHEAIALGRAPHRGRSTARQDGLLVDAALHRYDLLHLADRPVTALSGGEQQRVQLARAMVQLEAPSGPEGARWLLLDEPVTGLDPAHQVRALRAARDFAGGGGGVVCVLHDLRLAARYADRVALIEAGRLTALGAPGEVLSPARIQAAYGLEEEALDLFVG